MTTSTIPASGAIETTVGRYRWLVCALLFFATTINYIDRQILSLLKPILDEQLRWTNAQFGLVNSAFQAAYAVGLLLFGAFIDRVGTKIGYAVSIAAWSLAAVGARAGRERRAASSARASRWGWARAATSRRPSRPSRSGSRKRERAFATALFNSGANVGADHRAGDRPADRRSPGAGTRRS